MSNLSNGIFLRTGQKQKCATFVRNTSKTRCAPVKIEIGNCQHFQKFLSRNTSKTRYTRLKNEIGKNFGSEFPPPLESRSRVKIWFWNLFQNHVASKIKFDTGKYFLYSETGRIRFRRVRFQTPNSVSFFGAHWIPGSELSEFLSAYYLCSKANSPSVSQNSPSLPQNSVRLSEFSSLKQYSRNSIPLLFPIYIMQSCRLLELMVQIYNYITWKFVSKRALGILSHNYATSKVMS